jgi:hypothetical protein
MSLKSILAGIKKFFAPVDYQKVLDSAIVNLLADSELVSPLYTNILMTRKLTIILAELEGDVEARTHLSADSEPFIEVDVRKVLKLRDRLEPVIGHEIGHVHDAYYKYGVENFISIVAAESQMSWDQRTVEKSAILFENQVRAQLLKDHAKEYSGMAPTRERQNAAHRDFSI